ncbi:hypothetical protein L7F22_054999 [Adiantum nelumboides]|nr:hypothetical protein [Adiantum nelumboides]
MPAKAEVQIVRGVKEVPEEVKEVKGDDVLAASSQPMDVAPEPCQGSFASLLPAIVQVVSIDRLQHMQALEIATHFDQDVPPLADVALESCQGALAMADVAPEPYPGAEPSSCKLTAVTKRKKKKASKAQQIAREPCQGAPSKKPSKAPKAQRRPNEQNRCQHVQDLNVIEGSGTLKTQKSDQAKEVSGTTGVEPPKTQCYVIGEQEKDQGRREREEVTAVPEQHNVKKLKKMKEVGIREVAFELKLAINEVQVKNKGKGHTDKGQPEKGLEDKIVRRGMDGGGDDDSDDDSDDDADDDDGGSDNSGGGDDNADAYNDGTDDEDGDGGSDEGDDEGASEQDDGQDVNTDDEGDGDEVSTKDDEDNADNVSKVTPCGEEAIDVGSPSCETPDDFMDVVIHCGYSRKQV